MSDRSRRGRSSKPAPKTRPPDGIFVLGMHRSGTSLVTSLLCEYGFDFGGPHLPPQPDNPLGFWEHKDIVRIHDDFLQRLGRTWSDPRPFRPDEFGGKAAYWARDRLHEVLVRDFLSRPLWVLKDPRTARLGPLWEPVLANEGIKPKFLIVVRSPIAVVRSLAQRQGFSTHKTLLLWLRHYLEAESWTRGEQRSWVLFEDICGDPRGVVEGALRSFGFDDGLVKVPQTALDAILDPSLIHHNGEDDLKGELWTAIPWVDSTWQALKTLTEGEEDEVLGRIDTVRSSIGMADDLMMSDPIVWEVDALRDRAEGVRSIVEETRELIGLVHRDSGGCEESLAELRSMIASAGKSMSSLRKAWKITEDLLANNRTANEKTRSEVSAVADAVEGLSQDLVAGENGVIRLGQHLNDHKEQLSRLQDTTDRAVVAAVSASESVKENTAKIGKLKTTQAQAGTNIREMLRRLKQEFVEGNTAVLEELQQTAVTVGGEYTRHNETLLRLEAAQTQVETHLDDRLDRLEKKVVSGHSKSLAAFKGDVVGPLTHEMSRIIGLVDQQERLQVGCASAIESVDRLMKDRDNLIKDRDRAHRECDALSIERDRIYDVRDRLLNERNKLLGDRNAVAAQNDQLERDLRKTIDEMEGLREQRDRVEEKLEDILESRAWKATAPLRSLLDRLKGRKKTGYR